ncbi:NACHT domain-containing protein [Micromonospora andamanensis]
MHVDGLSASAIRTLVNYWHDEVVGKTRPIRQEAQRLSTSILKNSRVRALASNPLLLTTLLLVKRWVGQLPRRRSVLYDKAIEVLLMTWNSEGHEPIDPEEALPQLAYAAYSMMDEGATRVTSDQLAHLFNSARRDLPEELSYAKMPVHEFIRRVEERSSLMTLGGYIVDEGKLRPTYEFKHLTFQEYLAALAIAKGWLPARIRDEDVLSLLEPRLTEGGWEEVVTLTAVLSSRNAPKIVRRLIRLVEHAGAEAQDAEGGPAKMEVPRPEFMNLVGCLRDEAAITPEMAEEAIKVCCRALERSGATPSRLLFEALHGGRYDARTRELLIEIADSSKEPNSLLTVCADGWGQISLLDLRVAGVSKNRYDRWVLGHLTSGRREGFCLGAACLMQLSYRISPYGFNVDSEPVGYSMQESTRYTLDLLTNSMELQSIEALLASWAISWVLPNDSVGEAERVGLASRLAISLPALEDANLQHFHSWALASCFPLSRLDLSRAERRSVLEYARETSTSGYDHFLSRAALLILAYTGNARDRDKAIRRARALIKNERTFRKDLLHLVASAPRRA